MHAEVTSLVYWKSENDAKSCQDRLAISVNSGAFAVADGVGTSSWPEVWADILVHGYLRAPLHTDDMFELEYWLRPLQREYLESKDKPTQAWLLEHDPDGAENERRGGSSTLVACQHLGDGVWSAVSTIIGDSCLFYKTDASPNLTSWPLTKPEEFDRNPIVLPSRRVAFAHHFHRCGITEFRGNQGIVLLATDAVSRWLVGLDHQRGRFKSTSEGFEHITQMQSSDEWKSFIDDLRTTDEIIDDDSVALLIRWSADPAIAPATTTTTAATSTPALMPLGKRENPDPESISRRAEEFWKAVNNEDKLDIARIWGDGKWLEWAGATDQNQASKYTKGGQLGQAQRVAEAQTAILERFNFALDTMRNRSRKSVAQIVQPTIDQWASKIDFEHERSMTNLVLNLRNNGVVFPPYREASQRDDPPQQRRAETISVISQFNREVDSLTDPKRIAIASFVCNNAAELELLELKDMRQLDKDLPDVLSWLISQVDGNGNLARLRSFWKSPYIQKRAKELRKGLNLDACDLLEYLEDTSRLDDAYAREEVPEEKVRISNQQNHVRGRWKSWLQLKQQLAEVSNNPAASREADRGLLLARELDAAWLDNQLQKHTDLLKQADLATISMQLLRASRNDQDAAVLTAHKELIAVNGSDPLETFGGLEEVDRRLILNRLAWIKAVSENDYFLQLEQVFHGRHDPSWPGASLQLDRALRVAGCACELNLAIQRNDSPQAQRRALARLEAALPSDADLGRLVLESSKLTQLQMLPIDPGTQRPTLCSWIRQKLMNLGESKHDIV